MEILVFANLECGHDQKKLEFLAEQGLSCHVVTFGGPGWSKLDRPAELPSYVSSLSVFPYFSIRRCLQTFSTAFCLRRLAKAVHASVCLVLYVEPNALWANFDRFLGVRFVLFAYGTDVLQAIPRHCVRADWLNRIVSRLYRRAFSRAHTILATSGNQVDSIVAHLDVSATDERLGIIRTGLRLDRMQQAQVVHSSKAPVGPFVFFPRMMAPIYNHEFCLEAIARLPDDLRAGTVFVFVDSDTTHREYYHRIRAAAEDIEADFLFLPKLSQEDMFQFYQECALVVMTPVSDGAPVSGMEAMYFEKPLIMGPLPYDQDLFAPPVRILEAWDSCRLAQYMEATLRPPADLPGTRQRVVHLADAHKELKKLLSILRCAGGSGSGGLRLGPPINPG
jgi:glycosyltransferase involved in cell wall biosynthesis